MVYIPIDTAFSNLHLLSSYLFLNFSFYLFSFILSTFPRVFIDSLILSLPTNNNIAKHKPYFPNISLLLSFTHTLTTFSSSSYIVLSRRYLIFCLISILILLYFFFVINSGIDFTVHLQFQSLATFRAMIRAYLLTVLNYYYFSLQINLQKSLDNIKC